MFNLTILKFKTLLSDVTAFLGVISAKPSLLSGVYVHQIFKKFLQCGTI